MPNIERQVADAVTNDGQRRWLSDFFTATNNMAITCGILQADGTYIFGDGLRFQNITIPAGSTITLAKLKLISYDNLAGDTVRSRIHGELSVNPVTFSDLANYDARARTVLSVDWDGLDTWWQDVEYLSPDFADLVQEIIDQVGWTSGNSIVIFWDDEDARSTPAAYRRAHAFLSDSAKAVKLYVEYSEPLPTVTTDPASGVAIESATLNGTLDDQGAAACDCGFEWGETGAYGNTTPTQSKTTGQTFAQTITGLDPNKTYHFRAFATNPAGTSYGADRTFTTLVAVPTVTTDPASGVGATSATLNGTLDYQGIAPCDCGFEWGLDTGYGTTTATQTKETGETFSQALGGLHPNTTYHFRAFATNSAGTRYGADRSFTTALVITRAYALARQEL